MNPEMTQSSHYADAKKTSSRSFYVLIIVLLAVIAVGVYSWSIQLQNGLIVTNMRDVVSWGMYISLFAWFVGVSAGGLIVSSAA
ncbi:MAG: molybdopterin oxidoreductase, partial [Nitrososphaerota archaeon]|nr:molybdopterin oxidoreductase [Nitrososphaerota archaeon]